MNRSAIYALGIALTLALGVSCAFANSVDTFIKHLKDKDPDVRAKAAYEFCYG